MSDPNPKCWELDANSPLSGVLKWCVERHGVDRLLVTERRTTRGGGVYTFGTTISESVARLFGSELLETVSARRWPGSELIGGDGRVYVIRFDETVAARMCDLASSLADWHERGYLTLPEDPCLYRSGAPFPALMSVTHDRDAWVLDVIRPDLEGVSDTPEDPAGLLIPDPPTFLGS